MVFNHTWKAQNHLLSHEDCVCWADSMLGQLPVVEPTTAVRIPNWRETKTRMWLFFFLRLNRSELSCTAIYDGCIHRPLLSANTAQPCNDFSTSEPRRLASLLSYLLAHLGAHRPHTGPRQCRRTKPLFEIASTRSSVVQEGWVGG